MWRLLLHPQMKITKTELESEWCLDDVCEAHRILDAIDEITERERLKARG